MIKLPHIEPFEWTSKGVASTVLDLYGVGMSDDGKVVSPHYSPTMELLAYHTRTPGQRDFRMIGSNTPVGLHTLNNNRELIICEGHSDTYAAKTVFPKCDVIGVPGSDTVNSLTPYLSKLRKYKRITVMTDGDTAGNKCADALLQLLPKSKTYRTHLADGMDVSDYLTQNRHEELRSLYTVATANKSTWFVTEDDCERYANSPAYESISTGIPALDDMLGGGIGVAELTILAGYTGTGKSSLSQHIAINAAKSGNRVMYIAGEMTPKQNLDRLTHMWYGRPIRKDELVKCTAHVASNILITKFSDLTITNITDRMHESVLDHGVRLVIVDVLSDIEDFIHTDSTRAANIVRALHKACRGDDMDEVVPCGLLVVGHTKGTDEGDVELNDIRGGSAIKQVAECVITINEEKYGDMSNNNRVIKLKKRPRNREYDPTPFTVSYNNTTKHYEEMHATENSTNLRQFIRREVPSRVPSSEVPPTRSIPVGNSTETSTVRITEDTPIKQPVTVGTPEQVSVVVSPGLLLPNQSTVHRDEGNPESRGQAETEASMEDAPGHALQTSSATNPEDTNERTTLTDDGTESSNLDGERDALRTMYERNSKLLEKHRTHTYKTNHVVRANLIKLGYELQ